MRHDFVKTPAEIEADALKSEVDLLKAESQLDEFWERFRDSNPAEIKDFLQDKLSPYPPSQAQWILLLKLIGFILVLLKVLVKKVGIK